MVKDHQAPDQHHATTPHKPQDLHPLRLEANHPQPVTIAKASLTMDY